MFYKKNLTTIINLLLSDLDPKILHGDQVILNDMTSIIISINYYQYKRRVDCSGAVYQVIYKHQH